MPSRWFWRLQIKEVVYQLLVTLQKTLKIVFLVLFRGIFYFFLGLRIFKKIIWKILSNKFPKNLSQFRADLKKTRSLIINNQDIITVNKNLISRYFIFFKFLDIFWGTLLKNGVPFRLSSTKLFIQELKQKLKPTLKLDVFPEFISYPQWSTKNSFNNKIAKRMESLIVKGDINQSILISVVVPVFNPPPKFLIECVESVLAQVYLNWELILVDDSSTNTEIEVILHKYTCQDDRVKTISLGSNQGISAATNEAIHHARGEYIFFLDHDDVLSRDALFHVARALSKNQALEWLYTDEDKIDGQGNRYDPFFKGEWNRAMAQFHNFTHHATIVKKSVLLDLGGLSSDYPGAQDLDLNLRLLAVVLPQNICHIPHVCYHWRSHVGSTASSGDQKPYILQSAKNTILRSLKNQNLVVDDVMQPEIAKNNKWTLFQPHTYHDREIEDITIVIPTKNRGDLVKNCLNALHKTIELETLKILIINDHSDDEESLNYLQRLKDHKNIAILNSEYPPGDFNYARLINFASKRVTTKYFLQLNNDVEAITKNWLSEMLWWMKYPEVGVVGAKLIYPDQRIQHAGVFLGPHGGLADHQFHGVHLAESGYCGLPHIAREVSAVTGACMLTRTDLFQKLGGYDEIKFAVEYNDIDYCLRVADHGEKVVFSPAAVLKHITSASRGKKFNPQEHINFIEKYGMKRDKHIHPNFSRNDNRMVLSGQYFPYIDIAGDFRIVVFTHALTLTGAPITAFEYALAFKERGYQTLVISFSDGPLKKRLEEAGINYEIMFSDCNIYQISKSKLLSAIKGIFEKFKISPETDVVVGNTLLTFLPLEIAASRKISTLWHIHESVDFNKFVSLVGDLSLQVEARYALDHVDGVIFQAESTLGLFRKYIGANRIIKISGGMPIERIKKFKETNTKTCLREKYGLPVDAHIVSIIGTTCDRKGQLEFLDAMKRLVKFHKEELPPKMIFLIVGAIDSEYTNRLRNEIAKAIELDVRLVEETENIYDYYLITDTFVCNSKEESFPMVVLLAMAFMVPIVSTAVNGVVEMITSDSEGLLVPIGATSKLSEAVYRSIMHRSESETMAQRAYAKLIRQYDKNRLMDQHEHLINQVFYSC